jgi:hypothetical protein
MNWAKLLMLATPKKVTDRIVIVSVPKSGTYLLSELLKNRGFVQTFMHMGSTWADFFNPRRLEEGRTDPEKFRQPLPLKAALTRIPDHGFAVGHLAYSYETVRLLSRFKLIFLKRDLRDCIVSHMRFFIATGRCNARSANWYQEPDKRKQLIMFMLRAGLPLCLGIYENLVGWNEMADLFTLKFEDLIAGNITVIQQLLDYLGNRRTVSTDDMARVFAADTLTKSATPTRWQDYWSDDAEAIFRECRGHELNAELGYAPAASEHQSSAGRIWLSNAWRNI